MTIILANLATLQETTINEGMAETEKEDLADLLEIVCW